MLLPCFSTCQHIGDTVQSVLHFSRSFRIFCWCIYSWWCIYSESQQRVKIADILPEWISPRGGMPQGSWLGPLIFIVLIDDLRLTTLAHKFLDDTTMSEIIAKDTVSEMQRTVDALVEWSEVNHMNVNSKKTKEMVLGPLSKESTTPLLMTGNLVQQLTQYKLLGVTINAALKWDDHVDVITSKAAKRLWFLKKLKRTGVAKEDLAYFFQAVIRPILEYVCLAWHTSLTQEQSKSLENVQRRALQIIVGNIPYEEACLLFDLPTLAERRYSLCCSTLSKQITSESHVLHYLLPAKRDAQLASRL